MYEHFRGLIFCSQVPFDEVDMNYPDYYQAGEKVDKCRAKILAQYPELAQLLEKYEIALIEQSNFGAYREFEVGFRVGELMLKMLKNL